MADQSGNPSEGAAPPQRRRSSFVEFFQSRSATNAPTSSSPPSNSTPTAIPKSTGHNRSLSAALGLSTSSPSQSNPYNAFQRQRRASVTTSGSGSPEFRNSFGDEPAVIEEDEPMKPIGNTPPSPSFGRRLSFGAQALRDVRQASGPGSPGAAGRQPSSSLYTLREGQENKAPTTAATGGKSRGLSSLPQCSLGPKLSLCVSLHVHTTNCLSGEGFNWSESLRDRTKRSPSFSAGSPMTARPRAPSIPVAEPPKEIPKPAPTPVKMKKPDHLGERMLRGDFMMD